MGRMNGGLPPNAYMDWYVAFWNDAGMHSLPNSARPGDDLGQVSYGKLDSATDEDLEALRIAVQ